MLKQKYEIQLIITYCASVLWEGSDAIWLNNKHLISYANTYHAPIIASQKLSNIS